MRDGPAHLRVTDWMVTRLEGGVAGSPGRLARAVGRDATDAERIADLEIKGDRVMGAVIDVAIALDWVLLQLAEAEVVIDWSTFPERGADAG